MIELENVFIGEPEQNIEVSETDVIDYLEQEGQDTAGIDPVKVAKAIWRLIGDTIRGGEI